MKTQIVMVHIVTGATVSYSHALASLAGALQEANDERFEIALITIRDNNVDNPADRIAALDPVIVLVSVMSNQWERAKKLASAIKQRDRRIPCCVGGVHVAADPSSVAASEFDAGFAGEGENIIKSIVLKGGLTCDSVSERVHEFSTQNFFVEDLDQLPLPYIQLFNREDILEYPSVMFSRGCPFKCSYCMSRQGGIGGTVRWKSPQRAICEIHGLVAYAAPDEVFVDDDTLLKNPRWVREFCTLYRDTVNVPFFCNARPETVSPDIVRYLRDAQCSAIGIGIESGSVRIRQDILQRPMDDNTILRAFDAAHKAGLKTWSFNMVGLPGERPEDLLATIRLNEAAQTEFVRVSIFTPYPGTPIYNPEKHSPSPNSYFKGVNDLPQELRGLYQDWVSRLEREGRLWFTQSESDSQQQAAIQHGEVEKIRLNDQ